jgi:hypothetical protein
MPNVAVNIKNGVQKGPATDYSMLLEMKRRQLVVITQNALAGTKYQPIRDGQHTRGFTSGVVSYYATRGARLSFLRF